MSIVFRSLHGAVLTYDNKQRIEIKTEANMTIPTPSNSVLENDHKHHLPPNQRSSHKPPDVYEMKPELYAIFSPFMMDSQAERIIRESSDCSSLPHTNNVSKKSGTSSQRKRKRKVPFSLIGTELEICNLVQRALPQLLSEAQECGYLNADKQLADASRNNQDARVAAQIVGCGDLFPDICWQLDENILLAKEASTFVLPSDHQVNIKSSYLVGKLVKNTQETGQAVKVDGHVFLIPARASFLTSSFRHFVREFYRNIKVEHGYNLIVIDPPWMNKSVKRKKSYHSLDESELREIPIPQLACEGGLICLWVTNNSRLITYVKENLFPHWSVEWLADWIWVKVTQTGALVHSLDKGHKKPYEQLIMGRVRKTTTQKIQVDVCSYKNSQQMDCSQVVSTRAETRERKSCEPNVRRQDLCTVEGINDNSAQVKHLFNVSSKQFSGDSKRNRLWVDGDYESQNGEWRTHCLPNNYILVSVPCSLHSKKPLLFEVLSPFLPNQPKCLELFARNLLPDWTSWGNEPLRHQHADLYDRSSEITKAWTS